MSIKEALIGVFSDDPINWLKWGIVFAILIGGYINAHEGGFCPLTLQQI